MSRHLYLVRHAEQRDAEHGVIDSPISERGREQAALLATRLAPVPFDEKLTSPLDRARQTAQVLEPALQGPAFVDSTLLFDCVPSGFDGAPAPYERFFAGIPEEDIEAGEAQIADAAAQFLARTRDDSNVLLVTHNFVIGALVRTALDMPSWRWLGLNSSYCGITVLRVRSTKPAELLLFNDDSHLPLALRGGGTAAPLEI